MQHRHMQYRPTEHRQLDSTGLWSRRVVVDEGEHVVLVTDGRIERVLDTGVHRLRLRRGRARLVRLPAIEQIVTVPGQEMLTADGAGVRATVVAGVTITDPTVVVRNGGWFDQFYLRVQLAVRSLISSRSLADVLADRHGMDDELAVAISASASDLGLRFGTAAVRDLVVPGELRRAVGEVVAARLAGQAALERARGETAALRAMANAARVITDNPALIQLRLLQQMEQGTGNTYVIDAATDRSTLR